jgi:hypothetical protein
MGISLSSSYDLELDIGDPADFVIIGNTSGNTSKSFRSRKTIQEIVYDPGRERVTVFNGEVVSQH